VVTEFFFTTIHVRETLLLLKYENTRNPRIYQLPFLIPAWISTLERYIRSGRNNYSILERSSLVS